MSVQSMLYNIGISPQDGIESIAEAVCWLQWLVFLPGDVKPPPNFTLATQRSIAVQSDG